MISATVNSASDASIADGSITVSAVGGAGNYSYQWQTGATGPSLTGLFIGAYTVTVTDADGCTTTETYNITVSVGIGDADPAASINVYPNPTRGQLTIEGEQLQQLSVYNSMGQLVQATPTSEATTNRTTLNLEGLRAGIYILMVNSKAGRSTHRIVLK